MKLWPFDHAYLERGLWRAWLKNGQSLEVCWPTSWKRGWCDFSLRVLIHSNDEDQGDRMLNIALGFGQVFIPLGISRRSYQVGDEPSWGVSASRENAIRLTWGRWSRYWEIPFSAFCLEYQLEEIDGNWRKVSWENRDDAKSEAHPYTYHLQSGEVQERVATISRRRHIMSRRGLSRLGWPKKILHSIDVDFNAEVGERSGSWKGGCTGCSYSIRPGETPLAALRRMERERKF